MSKRIKMTPEEKLMKAIWGDNYKTSAEEEAEIEEFTKKVEAMTDEEFKAEFGRTREEEHERMKNMLEEIHWYDCVLQHQVKTGGAKNVFKLRDVAEIARYFYFAGRRHKEEGLDFDFNGNEVPEADGWEVKKKKDGK